MMNSFPLKFQQAESDKQKYLPQQGRCQRQQQQFARSRAAQRRRGSALAAATRHSGYGAQSPRQRQINERTKEQNWMKLRMKMEHTRMKNCTQEKERVEYGDSIFVDIEESEDEWKKFTIAIKEGRKEHNWMKKRMKKSTTYLLTYLSNSSCNKCFISNVDLIWA